MKKSREALNFHSGIEHLMYHCFANAKKVEYLPGVVRVTIDRDKLIKELKEGLNERNNN